MPAFARASPHAARAVADGGANHFLRCPPGEDAPALAALDDDADGCDGAGSVGASDVSSVHADDLRPVALEIANDAEALDPCRGRPLERYPVEDDLSPSALFCGGD